MTAEIKQIPLEQLVVYGIINTNMIPLTTYNLTEDENRQDVISEILSELSTKDVVIMGGTLVYTEGFDGFRIV